MMDRLTKEFEGHYYCNKTGDICENQKRNSADENCCCDCDILQKMHDKLGCYEKLEEQGKLLIPPCKPGDTVYVPQRIRIQKMTVISARIDRFGYWFFEWEAKDGKGTYPWFFGFSSGQIGKYVFLTEQEAKEALEGMKK